MCGIVGAVAERDVVHFLVDGLKRLEYRGYDSAGIAVMSDTIKRVRRTGRVAEMEAAAQAESLTGQVGIGHTRWATHGGVTELNAHPHISSGELALVHNGIIENHEELRAELQAKGYAFASQTDTEVIAHLVDALYQGDLFEAVQAAVRQLRGAYAIAVMAKDEPHRVVGARAGSPLILGVGQSENFLASDAMALAGVTDQIVYLAEGDVVDVQMGKHWIVDAQHQAVQREVHTVHAHSGAAELGPYRHYMQKEIFEQPRAIADTLEGIEGIVPELFDGPQTQAGHNAHRVFQDIDSVLILACGTSYYSGCVAKYWFESIAHIPCQVEVASEYRYRTSVPNPRTLVVTITQSGETADTLAALRHAQSLGMTHTLTICNVATSAMVRECELAYITRAGVEIGVASTKAFTAQLAGLFLLTLALAQSRGHLSDAEEARHLKAMRHLPAALQAVLALEPQIISWSEEFASKENALFLGRGTHYPIALEGALKLKEISYIHAEGYAAGELKHGPLALVDENMPVVAVAPNDELLEKLQSNLQEVRARGGELFVFADAELELVSEPHITVIGVPSVHRLLAPIVYVVPLQLLAYHVAVLRGTDVDQPRNLAKSVTVE